MSFEENMLLKFTQYQISSKTSSIWKSLNPEKLSTTKVGEHTPCGYSMSKIWTFNCIKTSMIYKEWSLYEKVLRFLRIAHTENN